MNQTIRCSITLLLAWAFGVSALARTTSGVAAFQRLDKGADGKLTPDEFPNTQWFMRMDKNGDDVVTLEEAKGAFSTGRQSRSSPRRESEKE